jgi:preprotein translocase subunit SecB
MSAHDTPLNLNNYAVLNCRMAVNPAYQPGKPSTFSFENLRIRNEVPKQPDDTNPVWIISLAIHLAPEPEHNMPYELELHIVGFFTVDPSCATELSRELAVTNGSSILFGTAREFLRTLTSAGPHPAIVLPAVSFTESAAKDDVQQDRK